MKPLQTFNHPSAQFKYLYLMGLKPWQVQYAAFQQGVLLTLKELTGTNEITLTKRP